MHNAQCGDLRGENTKPIIISMKQVVQGDGVQGDGGLFQLLFRVFGFEVSNFRLECYFRCSIKCVLV